MRIADYPKEERPREKLFRLGASSLSDSELLALFLSSGTKSKSALDLSREILSLSGGFQGLSSFDPKRLQDIGGVGEAKLCLLLGLGEILRRGAKPLGQDLDTFLLALQESPPPGEEAYVLKLGRKEEVEGVYLVGKSSSDALCVSLSEVLRIALVAKAKRFLFLHLHPSPSPLPSKQDIDWTIDLSEMASKAGLCFYDHVILGREASCSLKGLVRGLNAF